MLCNKFPPMTQLFVDYQGPRIIFLFKLHNSDFIVDNFLWKSFKGNIAPEWGPIIRSPGLIPGAINI